MQNIKNNANLPNFIIIGAGRSGTTSLYYYLKQHPEITMSLIKETNFFAYDPKTNDRLLNMDKAPFPVKRRKAYQKLFNNKNDRSLPGEASPMYLWHPSAPKNIYQSIPDVKLIAILRNLVDRIYSSFWLYVSLNMEKRTLAQAITEEKKFKAKGQWPSGHQAIRPSGHQAIRPSGHQAIRPYGIYF